MTRATATSVPDSRIRLKRMVIGSYSSTGLAEPCGGRGRGDRDGDRRGGLGCLRLGRQDGVARVLARGHDDDADDVQAGEADERPHPDGARQVAARGVDLDDLSDGDAGHEGLVAAGAEGHEPVARVDLGLAVEHLHGQGAVALSGGETELAGLLQAGADGEVGVVGEDHGGGVGADRRDASDESVPVEDGHVALDAVLAARVDGDGPGEALGRSYPDDLGALDAVLSGAGLLEHLVELVDAAAGLVVAAQLGLERGVLALKRGDPVVALTGVAYGPYGVGDRVHRGRHALLDGAEDRRGGLPGTVDRRLLARSDVHRDQSERDGDQQHQEQPSSLVCPSRAAACLPRRNPCG